MRIFRIAFHNMGKVYRLHAESISQSEIFGFLEINHLLFNEHTSLVIDPTEERLKEEFSDTQRILLPVNAVIRIDEVKKRGQNMIFEDTDNNVTPFPGFNPNNKND